MTRPPARLIEPAATPFTVMLPPAIVMSFGLVTLSRFRVRDGGTSLPDGRPVSSGAYRMFTPPVPGLKTGGTSKAVIGRVGPATPICTTAVVAPPLPTVILLELMAPPTKKLTRFTIAWFVEVKVTVFWKLI